MSDKVYGVLISRGPQGVAEISCVSGKVRSVVGATPDTPGFAQLAGARVGDIVSLAAEIVPGDGAQTSDRLHLIEVVGVSANLRPILDTALEHAKMCIATTEMSPDYLGTAARAAYGILAESGTEDDARVAAAGTLIGLT